MCSESAESQEVEQVNGSGGNCGLSGLNTALVWCPFRIPAHLSFEHMLRELEVEEHSENSFILKCFIFLYILNVFRKDGNKDKRLKE